MAVKTENRLKPAKPAQITANCENQRARVMREGQRGEERGEEGGQRGRRVGERWS